MGLFSKFQPPADAGSEASESLEKEQESPIVDDELGPLWPPSPKVQVLLITLGFILVNVILIAILVIVLWQRS